MNITKIRILLTDKNERLKGFVTVVIDNALCLNDLKIIEGTRGMFVAMPSRKITDYCKCGGKNILTAEFCNRCGERLEPNRGIPNEDGFIKYHSDIIHPITSEFREFLQNEIIKEYKTLTSEK